MRRSDRRSDTPPVDAQPFTDLGPLAQLRAPALGLRLVQLVVGLVGYGWSIAALLRSGLGASAWDVLTQGIARHVPWSFGLITIVTSVVVLLLWIPLRQWPGIGTVANVVIVGLSLDLGLALIPRAETPVLQVALFSVGLLALGFTDALYLGAQLGPGARDGLMSGLVRCTGGSVRVVRTAIEVTVLALGVALGGQFGLGTLLVAVLLGPLIQFFLPLVDVDARRARRPDVAEVATGVG